MWDVINKRALLIREPNEVRVLRLVRDIGQISRIEIARICELSKASVSDIVLQLIEAGFLQETGKAESTQKGGRKRILLRFQPLAGIVAGVDIKLNHTKVALTDLNATLLAEESFSYDVGIALSHVIHKIIETVDVLLRHSSGRRSKLVGIGIGVPGLIDYSTNALRFEHTMKDWQGESLSQEIETRFKVPVYAENDVKAMTLGEYLFGAGKGIRDLIHIWLGDGIGAGIIINGKLHRGITSSAGEIGYNELGYGLRSNPKQSLLYHGQNDFGELLSAKNLVDSYRRKTGTDSTIDEILMNAGRSEQLALELIEEFASFVSNICINLINTLNPEAIILGGQLVQGSEVIVQKVRAKIREDILSVPAEAVRIKPAELGESATVIGAAGLVLYELFEPLHSLSLRRIDRTKIQSSSLS